MVLGCTGIVAKTLPSVREEIDAVAVRVVNDGVALTPESVPGRLVALMVERHQLVVGTVDLGRGIQPEGQAHAVSRWAASNPDRRSE